MFTNPDFMILPNMTTFFNFREDNFGLESDILRQAAHMWGGGISADIIWGEKYEKGKRKRGKM
jgi:hypothetical protein